MSVSLIPPPLNGHAPGCWGAAYQAAGDALGWWSDPAERVAYAERLLATRRKTCTCGVLNGSSQLR